MRFIVSSFLFVLAVLLVMSSLPQDEVAYVEEEVHYSEWVGMNTIGCRSESRLREVIELGLTSGVRTAYKRFEELQQPKNPHEDPECEEVFFEGKERFSIIEEYPLRETLRNQLGVPTVVRMRRPDGTELYIELTRPMGPGHAI